MLWILCTFVIAADITSVIRSTIQHNNRYITQLAGGRGTGIGVERPMGGSVRAWTVRHLSAFG